MFKKDLRVLKKLPEKQSRIIAVDTETTGGSNEDNHILEIAAIEIINGSLTGKIFHGYIKPRRKINWMAIQVHKMTENFYKENFEGFYESDKSVMENFINFVKDDFVFAHNASFDCDFINYELKFWGLKQIQFNRFRCSCAIFQSLFRDSSLSDRLKGFSLGKCCEFFKINVNKEGLHSGLYDAMILAKLLCSVYTFLDKNPNYLSKKEVVDTSQFNKVLFKDEYKNKMLNQVNNINSSCYNADRNNHGFKSDKSIRVIDENQRSNSNNTFKNKEKIPQKEKNPISVFFKGKNTSILNNNINDSNITNNHNVKLNRDNIKINHNKKPSLNIINNKKANDKTNGIIETSFSLNRIISIKTAI